MDRQTDLDMTSRDGRHEMIRAFIAAEISEDTRAKIRDLLVQMERIESGVKWSRPSALHLTLRFLGGIRPDQVELAGQALAVAAAGFAPVKVEVRGWGTFPERKRPRVIWLGLAQGAEELTRIFEQLEPALMARGFGPADKRFSPHLTLGRIKSERGLNQVLRVLRAEAKAGFGTFRADRLVLFQSRLDPAGAVYTALREQKLGRE